MKLAQVHDPIVAILQRCHQVMPDASPAYKARWCMARQRELQRNGKVATAFGEIVPPFDAVADDPVIARLCEEGNR